MQMPRAVLLHDEQSAGVDCGSRRSAVAPNGSARASKRAACRDIGRVAALEAGRFLEGIRTLRYSPAVARQGTETWPHVRIASGTISFGLVAIPVKLYSTVDTTKAIHFNYLSKDGSRLKQQYVRASDGKVVEPNEKVQGYEFQKGQYVMFTPEELKAMNVEATNAIDIAEFIPLEDVERIFIEKVYYLGPDKGAARSYHLLRAALAKPSALRWPSTRRAARATSC